MMEVTVIVLLLAILANSDLTWAQYALDVELLLYETDWNARFPCPPDGDPCGVRYQYCLKAFGSPVGEACTISEYPTIIPTEMADNFAFNLTETFSFTDSSPIITDGQVQFFLEAGLRIPLIGVLTLEIFFLDVGDLEVDNSYTDVLSQSGVPPPGGIPSDPPGILTVRLRVRCEENMYGEDCSVFCAPRDDDSGHYICDMQGDRVCLTGYCNTVTDCAEECDECAANPCLNGGNCTDLFGGFNCSCLPTHSGKTCEEALKLISEADSTSNGLTTDVTTDATTATSLSPLIIGLIAGTVGACCVIISLVMVFGIIIIKVRRKLLIKAKTQPDDDGFVTAPIETSNDLTTSTNISYHRSEMFIGCKGDRDSYISMHSPHLYESISDFDIEKNDAEVNNETHTTVPRETVDESISDIDVENNDTEVNNPRETVV